MATEFGGTPPITGEPDRTEEARSRQAAPSGHPGFAAMQPSWLTAILRNRLEEIAAEEKGRPVVAQLPGGQDAILVLQRGGNHLLVTVQKVDVVPYG